MSKAVFQPLRVDFELLGPMVVPDRHPLLLDGLLLALQGTRLPLPFVSRQLPIQHVANPSWGAGEFVWLASALQVQWVGPASDRYLSRNAKTREILDDAAIHGGTVADSSRGMSKLARKRIMVRNAERATAWCLGDLAKVQQALASVTSIGAQRLLGFGQVHSCAVSVDAEANEKAWLRPVPGEHADDPYRGKRFLAAGRSTPPYWDRDLSLQAWWPEELA
jgi:CRISPR type IV-associated protein Csf3